MLNEVKHLAAINEIAWRYFAALNMTARLLGKSSQWYTQKLLVQSYYQIQRHRRISHMTHAETTYQRVTPANAAGDITIADVRFEHLRDALGIGTPRPRISWIVASAPDDWRQAGY